MAVAEITNIVIEKGTDFEVTFNLFDPDQSATVLSGLTTTYAKIRKHPEATSGEEFGKTITSGNGTIQNTFNSFRGRFLVQNQINKGKSQSKIHTISKLKLNYYKS